MRVLLLALFLFLALPCLGTTELEATTIIVNDLRMDLQQAPEWSQWDAVWREWFTIRDLWPYTGFW